jgi:menaquinone-specific isochorismate synthase
VAFSARGHGASRFRDVIDAAGGLWPRLREISHPDVVAPPPRLYGGFSFAPGRLAAPWHEFGDGEFVLPVCSYGIDQGAAWLRVVVSEWHEPARRHRWVGATEELLGRLATVAGALAAQSLPRTTDVAEASPDLWRQQVQEIRDAIAAERCEKIVAARSTTITLADAPPITAVLARLGATHGDCFRFCIRHGGTSFVGASPERLIARRGRDIETAALAGTAPVGAAAELLRSAKDRGEQAPVVRAIRAILEPLCATLEVPDEPRIRTLPGMLHLQTPIRGTLGASPQHVIELARALHPTPAVGGFPTAAALAWIAEHEPESRGWYAGPVGWFDAAGDGELAVAIRSGLLTATKAHLYAGAGIVRDSDPDAELAETRLKLRALSAALGVG